MIVSAFCINTRFFARATACIVLALSAGFTAAQQAQNIESCNVAVAFSAKPRALTKAEIAVVAGAFEGADWTTEGWIKEAAFTTEVAICACGNRSLVNGELASMADAIRRQTGGGGSSEKIAGIGRAYEFGPSNFSSSITERIRLVGPDSTPSCMLALTLRHTKETAPNSFLSQVTPLITVQPTGIARSLTDRLRSLDELLRQKLISSQEYEKARIKIIEQL